MAIKYIVESLDDLPEESRAMYKEHEGKYVLDVEGIPEPDVTPLKETLQKEREQRKALEAAQKEQERKLEEERRLQMEKDQEFKALWDEEKQKREATASELQQLRESMKNAAIEGKAAEIAAQLTKDTEKAEILKSLVQKYVTFEDGKAILEGGMSVETVREAMSTKYAFLVDGPGSAGARSKGSDARSATDVKTITRGEFDALDQLKRKEFLSKGGKING